MHMLHTPGNDAQDAQHDDMQSAHTPNEENRAVHDLAAQAAPLPRSRWHMFMSLQGAQRWRYFREQLALRTAAVLAALAVVIFLAVQLLTPKASPQLYVAIINADASDSSVSQWQNAVAEATGLPNGRNGGVFIDANFDLSEGGLTKLQTLLRNAQIDVIIAPHDAFATLAGYGYLTDLTQTLTDSQQASLKDAMVKFPGFDDSHEDDPDYDGSGKGAEEAFGISLTHAEHWDSSLIGSGSEDLVGLAQDSRHLTQSQQFIDYLDISSE